MRDEKYPVKRLSKTQFASALRKGQGRALLHVKEYGLEDVAGLVLEACLHNQVYDQQLESGRGDWLFSMFKDSPHYPEFRNSILNALESETDSWFLFQLCQLTSQISLLGDEEAHQNLKAFVYQNAADSTSEDDWLGVDDLLSIEGVEGVVGLARILGHRLLAHPSDFVNDASLHNEFYPKYVEVLNIYSQSDVAINIYLQYIEKRHSEIFSVKPVDTATRKQQNHEQARREFSLETILDDASKEVGRYPGHYLRFGRHATVEELEKVYTVLLKESTDAVRIRLLGVFRGANLPRLDEILFDWATSNNELLRRATIAALSQISDPIIHLLAKKRTEADKLLGADNDTFDLFINNYESGDELLMRNALDRIQPDLDDAHSLGYSILLLGDKHADDALKGLLLWVYENTPCAHCRSRSIKWLDSIHQFSDELRFECEFDSDEDLREYARGKGIN